MWTASAAFVAALAAPPYVTRRKAEVFDLDGVLVRELANITSGNVSADFSREHRRTGTLTIEAPLADEKTATFWIGRRVKMSMGLSTSTTATTNPAGTPGATRDHVFEYVPLGFFDVVRVRIAERGSGEVVALDLIERSHSIELRAFERSETREAGAGIVPTIRAFAVDAGETNPNLVFSVFADAILPRRTQFMIGESRWRAMKSLAKSINGVLRYAADGKLYLEPLTLLAGAVPVASLEIGDVVAGASTDVDIGGIHNRVVVTGSSASKSVGFGVAEDVRSGSATAISRIGRRTLFVTDSTLPDSDAAQARADLELDRQTTLGDRIDFSAVADWRLEPGDVVHVRSRTFEADCYLETVSFQFGPGFTMTCRARRLLS